MFDAIAYCVTAILVSIILAGGINRAAYYTSLSIVTYLRERDYLRREQHAKIVDEKIHRKD